MQHVFRLNSDRSVLSMVSSAEARHLLRRGECAVFRRFPFVIIHNQQQPSQNIEYRLKINPGAAWTGIAILKGNHVVWAAEIKHRGFLIKLVLESRRSLRRGRRNRKTRYREPRFLNRTRTEKWIPPSLVSRVENIKTWVARIMSFCNITSFAFQSHRFDTQKLLNPDISGIEYQQGELHGYEIREYLLEKFQRKCVYCNYDFLKQGKTFRRAEIDHIHPKSKGGSDRISNLVLSCEPCNKKKNNQLLEDFLKGDTKKIQQIQAQVKKPLASAAIVNVTRRYIQQYLYSLGLPVECSTGGRTKYNRSRFNLPKSHWLDAACVGNMDGYSSLDVSGIKPLIIKAMGHGKRQMMATDKYGFPKGTPKLRARHSYGFRTGDWAIATIEKGKYKGTYTGRVVIRSKPSFSICSKVTTHPRNLKKIHSSDGYDYA